MRPLVCLLLGFISVNASAQSVGAYVGLNKSLRIGGSEVTSNKPKTGLNAGLYAQFKGVRSRHTKIELNYSMFRGTLDGQVGESSHYIYSSSYTHVRYADFTDHRVLLGISFFEFPFCNKKLLITPGFQLGASVSNKIEGNKEDVTTNGQAVAINYSRYVRTEKFNYLQCGVTMNMSYLISLNKSKTLFACPELRGFSAYEYNLKRQQGYAEFNVRSGFSFNLGLRKMLAPKKKKEEGNS